MIIQCDKCGLHFEDVYRSTICPHNSFPANDGNNNFKVHDDAYLEHNQSDEAPLQDEMRYYPIETRTGYTVIVSR